MVFFSGGLLAYSAGGPVGAVPTRLGRRPWAQHRSGAFARLLPTGAAMEAWTLGCGDDPLWPTDDPADDYEPVFSPDGSQIAFHSDRDSYGIYVVSVFGGQARRDRPAMVATGAIRRRGIRSRTQ
jgi:hypothetical protein